MASSRSSKNVHSEVESDLVGEQYENVHCSELRVKGFVLIEGRPCKIVEMSRSKTGKHGSCKIHLVAIDAFTGRKRIAARTSSDVVQTPLIGKRECRLLRIVDVGETARATEPTELLVEEKQPIGGHRAEGAEPQVTRVRLSADRAAQLLETARQLLADDGADAIVTVMTAMGEEAAVAIRRARDRGGNLY